MKYAAQFALWLYERLLGFYPRNFRYEFGEEIVLVFDEAVNDAVNLSGWALFRVSIRELRDLPKALFGAYWHEIQDGIGGYRMFDFRNEEMWKIEDHREAIVAALPPLIFGFAMALSALIIREPWYKVPEWRMILGIGVTLFASAILAVGGIQALRKRIPDWGYSWIGYSYMGLVLFVKTFAEEQADEGLSMISPVVDNIIAILVLLGMAVFLGIAVLRGWRQAGLLSFSYAGMMGISLFGMLSAAPINRSDLTLLVAPASLIAAFLVYLYCRSTDMQRVLSMFGLVLLYAGVLWAILYAWQPWYLERGGTSPILPLFVIFLILLLSGPMLGILGTPLRRILRKT